MTVWQWQYTYIPGYLKVISIIFLFMSHNITTYNITIIVFTVDVQSGHST